MRRIATLMAGLGIGMAAALAGCSPEAGKPAAGKTGAAESSDAQEGRRAFEALQAALKAKDGEAVWALLDEDSRADAERSAKAIRDSYEKAAAGERAELAKQLGLAGADLAKLQGVGFLKTSRFLGTYDEIPTSTVEKVTVQGERATVAYLEPDGDREKVTLVRQGGAWRAALPMPKGR